MQEQALFDLFQWSSSRPRPSTWLRMIEDHVATPGTTIQELFIVLVRFFIDVQKSTKGVQLGFGVRNEQGFDEASNHIGNIERH